jgi:hypothetical protein
LQCSIPLQGGIRLILEKRGSDPFDSMSWLSSSFSGRGLQGVRRTVNCRLGSLPTLADNSLILRAVLQSKIKN